MCEPIYHNTSESIADSDASGVVMNEKDLLDAVNDCQRIFRRGDPEKELKDKYRYINIIVNATCMAESLMTLEHAYIVDVLHKARSSFNLASEKCHRNRSKVLVDSCTVI
jgi:hypothetical protein